MNSRKIALIIAIIGLVVSIYLTILRYSTVLPLECPNSGVIDCAGVLSSQYSVIFGIPNVLLGLVFFIAEIFVIIKYFGKEEMLFLNAVGLLFVLYYISTEYILGKICLYCTTVHICTIMLLAISIKYYKKAG
jgi:uncharacterized membrane protein